MDVNRKRGKLLSGNSLLGSPFREQSWGQAKGPSSLPGVLVNLGDMPSCGAEAKATPIFLLSWLLFLRAPSQFLCQPTLYLAHGACLVHRGCVPLSFSACLEVLSLPRSLCPLVAAVRFLPGTASCVSTNHTGLYAHPSQASFQLLIIPYTRNRALEHESYTTDTYQSHEIRRMLKSDLRSSAVSHKSL